LQINLWSFSLPFLSIWEMFWRSRAARHLDFRKLLPIWISVSVVVNMDRNKKMHFPAGKECEVMPAVKTKRPSQYKTETASYM